MPVRRRAGAISYGPPPPTPTAAGSQPVRRAGAPPRCERRPPAASPTGSPSARQQCPDLACAETARRSTSPRAEFNKIRPSAGSGGARVELQGDVVGVAERYEVARGARDDVAMYDSVLVQPGHPRVESGPVRDGEAQVVEAGLPLIEGATLGQVAVAHERHDHAVTREHRLVEPVVVEPPELPEAEHPYVPLHAPVQVAHAQRDVVDACNRRLAHDRSQPPGRTAVEGSFPDATRRTHRACRGRSIRRGMYTTTHCLPYRYRSSPRAVQVLSPRSRRPFSRSHLRPRLSRHV